MSCIFYDLTCKYCVANLMEAFKLDRAMRRSCQGYTSFQAGSALMTSPFEFPLWPLVMLRGTCTRLAVLGVELVEFAAGELHAYKT